MTAASRWVTGVTLCVALVACGGDGGGSSPDPDPDPDPIVLTVRLSRAGGDQQVGVAGTPLPVPLALRATDTLGAPAAGVTIAWTVASGGGGVSPATSVTDAEGRASATWTPAEPVTGGSVNAVAIAGGNAVSAALGFAVSAVAAAPAAFLKAVPIPSNYGIHDTYVRDGLAFVSAWSTGLIIYDVGNGIRGGSPSRPIEVSRYLPPAGPSGLQCCIHNAWWFHNPVTNEKRYVFLGQEGPGSIGSTASGDLYVLDVGNLAAPTVVATYRLNGAGAHNVWVDEAAQVLYAAYYNGGVVAFDVSGTISGDLAAREIARVQPGGAASTFTWGVQVHRGTVWAADMESGLWRLSDAAGGLSTLSGGFNVPDRWTSDLWLHGDYAYTGTWGGIPRNGNLGDQIKVWNVATGVPTPAGAVTVAGTGTISDVEVSADGRLLLATTERGSVHGFQLYSLANPAAPAFVTSVDVDTGLHTGTFWEFAGRRYVFAAKNPGDPALVIYDVTGAAP